MTWLGSTWFDADRSTLLRGERRGHVHLPEKRLLSALLTFQGQCVPLTVIRSTLWDHLANPPNDKYLDLIVFRLRAVLADIAPEVQMERISGIGIRLLVPGAPPFCPVCGSKLEGR